MNTFGLFAGLITLLIIGLGFPLVIYAERLFGFLCWPYLIALGVLVAAVSLFIQNSWLSVVVGVLGATLVWGSTEVKEQAVRAQLGWFLWNPNKTRVPFAGIIERWKAPQL